MSRLVNIRVAGTREEMLTKLDVLMTGKSGLEADILQALARHINRVEDDKVIAFSVSGSLKVDHIMRAVK